MYLLPLKVPHRKIEFWIVFMFIYLFIHSLIRIFFYYYLFVSLNLIYINQVWHFCFEIVQKYNAHLRPLKVRHRNLELWIDLFNVYLDSCLFLGLNWFLLNTGMTFLFWKSFNNRPAFIYFHSKCLTARLSFELYLCLFIYSFIHLFVFFFLLLFICFTYLIYINQVWHFCFEIVQKYTPIYFHSKCVTAT